MNMFNLFRRGSAPVARERLQILLAHEREARDQPDLLGILREEILEVISRHVAFEPDKVQIKVDRGKSYSTLAVDIEIPNGRRASGGGGMPQLGRLAFNAEAATARSQWTNGLV
jgi:cell division topological specificity factor